MIKHSLKSQVKIEFPIAARDRVAISLEIEYIYSLCPETTYMDAVIAWAESNDVDIEQINDCIVEPLRQKIRNEAISMNLVKNTVASSGSLEFLM